MVKNKSIRFLVLGSLALVFLLVLTVTLMYSAATQRARMEQYTLHQVEGLSKSYFDALNTMMLTGAMGNRQILRDKILATDDIKDVRLIRGENISAVYGAGFDNEKPVDELDQRALSGEKIELIHENNQGRMLTVVKPIRARADYQGVNCLGCHQVNEGTVLGAVRIDYSLAASDEALQYSLLTGSAVQTFLFLIGFAVAALLLNSLVIKRLKYLHDAMADITENSDLSITLDVTRDDEIGSVSRAFNRMIAQFKSSLSHVVDNAEQVHDAAQTIARLAEATEKEVLEQRNNTDQVATAMTEMAASAEEVKGNAITTTSESRQTADAATVGEEQTQAAVTGIEALSSRVQEGALRIEQLNQRTDEVAAVLAVISSIAEQTNLLALNAAIEAARAGEQGRGFAVVADEVRSLALRTQESTEEIRHTIGGLRSDASDCVKIMGDAAGQAQKQVSSILLVSEELQQIASAVRGISSLNSQMEVAANEQSQVAESINCNVIGISESAESTSVDAKQTARIAEELLAMADALKTTVSQFKLGN